MFSGLFKSKQKQKIEMRGETDGSGIGYGYTDGKLVCATCGKSATSKSSLIPVPLIEGRSAGVCGFCAVAIAAYDALMELAGQLADSEDGFENNPLGIECIGEPASCEHEDCQHSGVLYESPLATRPFGACDEHVDEVAAKVTFENRAALN